MSVMSEICITIDEMCYDGASIDDIAKAVGLPVDDVRAYIESTDYNDIMDGDFDSAMASAGWGTDEDYNCYVDDFQ